MIRGKVRTRSGALVFVQNEADFIHLVEHEIGDDAAQLTHELVDLANMTQQRLQTDLDSYESELSELQEAIRDLQRVPDQLIALSNRQHLNVTDKSDLRRAASAIRNVLSLV